MKNLPIVLTVLCGLLFSGTASAQKRPLPFNGALKPNSLYMGQWKESWNTGYGNRPVPGNKPFTHTNTRTCRALRLVIRTDAQGGIKAGRVCTGEFSSSYTTYQRCNASPRRLSNFGPSFSKHGSCSVDLSRSPHSFTKINIEYRKRPSATRTSKDLHTLRITADGRLEVLGTNDPKRDIVPLERIQQLPDSTWNWARGL